MLKLYIKNIQFIVNRRVLALAITYVKFYIPIIIIPFTDISLNSKIPKINQAYPKSLTALVI